MIETLPVQNYPQIMLLARQYQAQGLCRQAEDLYIEAITLAKALPESKAQLPSRALIETLSELATFYAFQGKDEQAAELWCDILELGKNKFTGKDPIYIDTIFKLAGQAEKSHNFIKAEALYKELLKKQKSESGNQSLATVPALKRLAAFYCHEQDYLRAESLYLDVLAIEEYHLGTCSEEINGTVSALIDIFEKLKKWRLAEYMLGRQRAILSVIHGQDSLCLASCELRLAELFTKTGRMERASQSFTTTVQIYTRIFGEKGQTCDGAEEKIR